MKTSRTKAIFSLCHMYFLLAQLLWLPRRVPDALPGCSRVDVGGPHHAQVEARSWPPGDPAVVLHARQVQLLGVREGGKSEQHMGDLCV